MVNSLRWINCIFRSYLTWAIILFFFIVNFLANKHNIHNKLQEQKLQKNFKTILYWNKYYFAPDYKFGFGNEPFVQKCEINNCYVTNNRSYTSLENFDAILFHGPLFRPRNISEIPHIRSPKQHYVVLSHECPIKFPYNYGFPNLFNLTMTYRMDSDIYVPYFRYYDAQDKFVGPKLKPSWISPIHHSNYLKQFMDIYERKSKPVSWLVSNFMGTFNKRYEYTTELQKFLSVDIYGKVGTLQCSSDGDMSCFNQFKNDYFFYLAFENANCVDYVTEKLHTALKNEVIPVIMNGGDMIRIAPPYSYIDAREYEPKELAKYLKFLMANPMEYLKYHWWRKTYYIVGMEIEDPHCNLCEFLNTPQNRKSSSYADYQEWYHGSPGNRICTMQVLKNSDYIPQADPEINFHFENHASSICI